MEVTECVERDKRNAKVAKVLAAEKAAAGKGFQPRVNMAGVVEGASVAVGLDKSQASYHAIAQHPFDAVIEADVEAALGKQRHLFYANQRTATNESFKDASGEIRILSWTHPIIQLAMSGGLRVRRALQTPGFALKAVTPIARGRFRQLTPTLKALYEPGGVVNESPGEPEPRHDVGLKAVKLSMTKEQVDAFLSRMDGVLMILGAPGTGKTTVGFQRIRFLFDQQWEQAKPLAVRYTAPLTRVFLANQNLINYTRDLLVSELDVTADAVHLVSNFVADYVGDKWRHKRGARPRQRRTAHEEQRGREAFFNLCKPTVLAALWAVYERQILDRLKQAPDAEWIAVARLADTVGMASVSNARLEKGEIEKATLRLATALFEDVPLSDNPLHSHLRCDALYARVGKYYEASRDAFDQPSRNTQTQEQLRQQRERFDEAFSRWLFEVYDPLDAMVVYFSEHLAEGLERVKAGTRQLFTPEEIAAAVLHDWIPASARDENDSEDRAVRQYGREEEGWIAWLLRFALPEGLGDGFRGMPSAFPDGPRWTHVLIDEAQDLAVQEASLLSSLAHPHGALTVSADFRQVVSPVHGMEEPEALKFCSPIREAGTYSFPFNCNMRQSREIGLFLKSFYQAAFHEMAPFDARPYAAGGAKPVVFVGSADKFVYEIMRRMKVLDGGGKVRTIAVLQIDEDVLALNTLRNALVEYGVPLAPAGALQGAAGELVLATVEQAKGLEFDACIVLGLDDVDRSSLNFSKNRAYVALSRPTQRLIMLCEEPPAILERVSIDLYDYYEIK